MDTIRSIFEDYKVSIHYIIDRDGKILCYIPEDLVAYHAGYGSWKDDPKYADNLNNYSIGIELAAIGSASEMAQYLTEKEYQSLSPELIGYTDAQYAALKSLVSDICARNDIPVDRDHIIGHEEYYPKKTDPGELFDWRDCFRDCIFCVIWYDKRKGGVFDGKRTTFRRIGDPDGTGKSRAHLY